MLNQKSIEAVAKAQFKNNFLRPLYSSYCFSRIPATIKSLFKKGDYKSLPADTVSDSEYDHVILFLIDGFGWRYLLRYAERYPFLKRIIEEGTASMITSQFPSTTAAHVTCINTGLSTGESGVYEWFYYEPKVDSVIAPLLYSFAGDKAPGTLKNIIKPEEIFPTSTFYQDLKEMGVDSYVIQDADIIDSPYSSAMFRGARPYPYVHWSEALQTLSKLQTEARGKKSYFFLYFGDIDSAGHRHGIFSSQYEAAVEECFSELEKWVCQEKTACLLTADHGMTMVDPQTTIYLNKAIPECTKWFRQNRKGEILVPSGSCRDFFLNLKEEFLDEAKERLEDVFKDKAAVFYTKDLISEHFFCEGSPSNVFLERVGNLVILPYGNESIWWYEKNRFDQHFYAMHGGLTPEELEIPLIFWEK